MQYVSLQLKPIQLNQDEFQQFCQYPVSYNTDYVVYQSVSNGMNSFYMNTNYCPSSPRINQRTQRNALTYENLKTNGIAFITEEQKISRVQEWLLSDRSNCLYPLERH